MTLARHLARLGHAVALASPRGSEHVVAVARELGASAVSVERAAHSNGVVILAIPTKVVVGLPRPLVADPALGTVVIDLTNYHPELRDGRIAAIEQGMLESEWVAQQIGHPVIKAFNNIFAGSLLEKGVPRGTPGRVALPVAGDSHDAKSTVLRLVDELGFDPVDAGELKDSWRQGTGTPAYCKDLDAEALRRALAEADRSRISDYRALEEARIKRSFAPATDA